MPRGKPLRANRCPRAVFFTVGDLVRMLDVDPKTVMAWARRLEIPSFRTPGGQHRFVPTAARDLFVKSGFDIPEEVTNALPPTAPPKTEAA